MTSRDAYDNYRGHFLQVNWGLRIWGQHIPPTRSTLVWRIIWNKIPAWDVLHSFGVAGPSVCLFCWQSEELVDHIFAQCPFAAAIISNINMVFGLEVDGLFGFHDLLLQVINCKLSPRTTNLWKLTWTIFFLDDMESSQCRYI